MANEVNIRISADASGVQRGADQAERSLKGVGRSASDAFDTRGLEGFKSGLGGIAAIAATAATALAGLAVGKLVAVEREFGTLNAQLKTATGSVAAANAKFGEMETLAGKLPESLADTVGAFIKLQNLGLDPSEKAIESYSNTASAMGKSLTDMIEAVADASTGEFERLKEFGIKASKQGNEVKFTFQGVTTTVKNNASEIEAYLQKIGNVNFAGASAEKMKTLEGAISNLGDTWDGVFRKINGAGFGDLLGDGIRGITAELGSLGDTLAAEIGGAAKDMSAWFAENREELGLIWDQTKLLVADIWDAGKAFASWLSEMEQANDGLELIGTAVLAVRIGFAGLVDGVKILSAGIAKMGAMIYDAMVWPLLKVQEAMSGVLAAGSKIADFYAKAAGVIGADDIAAQWRGAADSANSFNATIQKSAKSVKDHASGFHEFADGIFAAFGRGDTAVQRVLNPTEKLAEATKKAGAAADDSAGRHRKLAADTDAAGKAAKAAADAYASLINGLQGKLVKVDDKSEVARVEHVLATDKALKGLSGTMKAYALGLAEAVDTSAAFEKVLAEQAKASDDAHKANMKLVESAQQAFEAARDELENYGKSRGDIARAVSEKKRLEVATLDQAIAQLEFNKAQQGGNLLLDAEIGLLREKRGAIARLVELNDKAADAFDGVDGKKLADDMAKAAADAAKKAEEDWKSAANSISQSLTDAILRGFESGKDFAQNFKDTLKNMFQTLVLQPTIKAIMAPVAGGLASLLPGTATAGGLPSSLLGGVGGGFDFSGISGFFSKVMGSNLGAGAFDVLGSTGMGLATQSTGLGALGGLSGLSTLALPLLGLAIPLISKLFNKKGGPKEGGEAWYGNKVFDAWTPDGADGKVGQVMGKFGDALSVSLKALGLKQLDGLSANLGFDSDPKGTAGSRVSSGLFVNGKEIYGQLAELGKDGDISAEMGVQFGRLVLAGIKASDLPDELAKAFDGVDISALDEAGVQALQAKLQGIKAVTDAFIQLGDTMPQLAGLSSDARMALAEVAGGLDAMVQGIGSYYQNFYSESERTGIATRQLSDALGKLGYSLPANREEFRKLVEAQDLSTEAGRQNYATLIKLSGAFAELSQAASGLGGSLSDLAANALAGLERSINAQRQQISTDLAGKLDVLQQQKAELSAKYEADKAILQAQEAARKQAASTAAASLRESLSGLQRLFDALQSGIDSLVQKSAASMAGALDAALIAARAGDFSKAQQLDIGSITRIDENAFGSAFDLQRAKLQTAGKLTELQGLAGGKLTAGNAQLAALESISSAVSGAVEALDRQYKLDAEQLDKQMAEERKKAEEQLKSLDDLLSNAKEQLEIANGTWQETKNLGVAQREYADAIRELVQQQGKRSEAADARFEALLKAQQEMVAELQQLRAEQAAQARAVAANTQATAKVLQRWDGDGQPEVRT
ncbi:tape measure protein [Chitinilyticum aquatile]|uniref:tape measure protein n=1 Tax=Chitinilyticum aquatile TaxID=362520 RepID=UPI000401A46C|nr:tape measure protein [Chitinilyticum aquatile]